MFVSGTLNFLHLFQKILKQQRILIIYQKRCQTGVMAYEKLSTLHELSNLENHLKKMFSVWLYQSPHHIVVEGLWPTLVYSVMYRSAKAHHSFQSRRGLDFDWAIATLSFLFFNHSVWYFLFCGHCPAAVLESSWLLQWLRDHVAAKQNKQTKYFFVLFFCVCLQFLHVNLLWHQTLGQWFWILSTCE